jgi:hypothetical protein
MNSQPRKSAVVYALYANAALLVAILLALLARRSGEPALAQYQPAIGGGAGVFVVPAQFSRDIFGCYLLDVDAQTLCVYRFDPLASTLKLAAARNVKFDRKLGNFNVASPSPQEVKELLDQESRGSRAPAPTSTQP